MKLFQYIKKVFQHLAQMLKNFFIDKANFGHKTIKTQNRN
ncbi:hypothetical protein D1AOALGA4SA_6344 [Olavius algarvensis Delta 1 endosymbiont]|nr:hypothetical protein D1AOALGA4SA_6344 [Olavius algarvensis Delta 1 endosymbiont]